MELFHPNLYDSNYQNDDDMNRQKAIALNGQQIMIPLVDPMLNIVNSMQGKEVDTKSEIPDIFEYMNRFNGKKDGKKDGKKNNEKSVLQQQQQSDAEIRSEHISTSSSTNSSTTIVEKTTENMSNGTVKVTEKMGDGSFYIVEKKVDGSELAKRVSSDGVIVKVTEKTPDGKTYIVSSTSPTSTSTTTTIAIPSPTSEFELTSLKNNPKLTQKANVFTSNITNKIYVMIFVIEENKTYDEFKILCINDKEIFNGTFDRTKSPLINLNDISSKEYNNFFKFNNISLTFVDINNDRCYYYSYETNDIRTISTTGTKTITFKSYNDTVANPTTYINKDVQLFFEHFVRFHVPEELLDH